VGGPAIDIYAPSAPEPAQQYLEYERAILLALNINALILELHDDLFQRVDGVDSEVDELLTQFTWEPTQFS
jgi:hypothetical protein